jgi:hypothetical protein
MTDTDGAAEGPIPGVPVPPPPGVMPETEYDRSQDPEFLRRKIEAELREKEDARASMDRILDTPHEEKIGERTYFVTSRPFHIYTQIVNEMAKLGLIPATLQRHLNEAGEDAAVEAVMEAIGRAGEEGDRIRARIMQLLVQPPPEKVADCRPLEESEYLLPMSVALFCGTRSQLARMLNAFIVRDHLIGEARIRKTLALLTKRD